MNIVRSGLDAGAADEWGLDAGCREWADRAVGWRWSVRLDGRHNLPDGPGVLVANLRAGVLVPAVVARAVWQVTGRVLRLTGLPDFEPIGPVLRGVGGVVAVPAEVRGLLRAGELVGVWCGWPSRDAAMPRADLLAPAVMLGVPVVPVAVRGGVLGRAVDVVCGPPIVPVPGSEPAFVARATGVAVQRLSGRRRPSGHRQAEGAADHEPLDL